MIEMVVYAIHWTVIVGMTLTGAVGVWKIFD